MPPGHKTLVRRTDSYERRRKSLRPLFTNFFYLVAKGKVLEAIIDDSHVRHLEHDSLARDLGFSSSMFAGILSLQKLETVFLLGELISVADVIQVCVSRLTNMIACFQILR